MNESSIYDSIVTKYLAFNFLGTFCKGLKIKYRRFLGRLSTKVIYWLEVVTDVFV